MDQSRTITWRQHALFWGLALAGLTADLATKQWVFRQPDLLRHEVRWFWPGHVGLQLSLNEGALFGMGQGNVALFAALALAAAAAIPAWLFLSGAARDLRLTVVLGAILGGILGNAYDRLGLPGLDWGGFDPARAGQRVHAVRDFFLVAWLWDDDWQHRVVWPNFNLADSLLVCGAAALFWLSRRPGVADGENAPQPHAAAPSPR